MTTTNVILGETFPVRDLPLTEVVESGMFVQDEIRPADSRWSLVPALRVDYYDLTPNVDAIYAEDNPSSQPVGLEDVSFAPKLGATYRLNDTVGLFFQYAHGYRAPPPEEVNIGLEIPLFKVRAVPNPDLQPEISDGFELGLRRSGHGAAISRRASSTPSTATSSQSKVNIGVDPGSGFTLFQSQNVAEARIYGAELAAVWRAGDATRGARGLDRAPGGFLDARRQPRRPTSHSIRSTRRASCSGCATTRRRRAGAANSWSRPSRPRRR